MSNKLLVQQKTKTKKKNNKRRGSRKGETLNTQLHTSSCKMNETSILPHNRNSNSKKHNKILWLTDLYLKGTRISTMSPFQIFPNLVKKKRSKKKCEKKGVGRGKKENKDGNTGNYVVARQPPNNDRLQHCIFSV